MISEFPLHAADMGFRVTGPLVADGKIHRANWKPSRPPSYKATWYVVFGDDTYSTVVWGDYQDGFRDVWSSKAGNRMTSAERAAFKAHTAAVREQEERDRRAAADSARRRAWAMWCDAEVEIGPHDYLTRKQIGPEYLRARTHDGRVELLVPLRDGSGELCNLQRIWPDGTKRFVKNAGVAGLHWRTGPMPDEDFTGDVAITEGVATAGTVRRLAGITVFAAIAANNLVAVTTWVRKRLPMARILIAADDDRWEKDGTARPLEKNIGRMKSMEAAEGTRALVLFPTFSDLQNRGTDWNDLWCDEGEPMARNRWTSAVTIAALDRQVALMSDVEYNRRRAELQTAYTNAGARMGTRELDTRRRGGREETAEADGERSPVEIASQIVNEAALWHDQFGVAHATLNHEGLSVNTKVDGCFFRDWLRVNFDEETSGVILGETILKAVVEQTASTARLRSPEFLTYYRMGAGPDGAHWLDLGRNDWMMARIAADGWCLTSDCPIKFIHGDGNCALPIPVRSPDLIGMQPLWDLLNIGPDDRCLVAGFLLSAMLPSAPCFGLNLYGGKGSAKSTATRMLRSLLDPSPAAFQGINEKKLDDLGISCLQQWIPCFENISRLEPEVQDVLCSLTTSLAAKVRKLYSNTDVVSYEIRRPWIINGINNVCNRSDLAERAIPVELLPAPQETRERERIIWGRFYEVQPHILAVLLDAAALAKKDQDHAAKFLAANRLTHRMADALEWITAGEPALGFPAGSFIERLNQLQEDAGFEALDGNPMVAALESLVNSSSRGYWQGTHEEILEHMHEAYPDSKRNKYMPHDAIGVGNWLRREGDRLAKSFGLQVGERFKKQIGGRRQWVREITRINIEEPTT